MDYEKKYKEAINRAKAMVKVANSQEEIYNSVITIFPELKESEDEKIRKELITHCRNTRCVTEEGAEKIAKWIAWLEKQGEQKLPIEKLPSEMKTIGESLGLTTQEECDKYNQMVSDIIMSDGNEIKPKFKVGDTIRLKKSTAEYTVESISDGCYHGKGWGLDISCDNDYELVEQEPAWSEEDEKMMNSFLHKVKVCNLLTNKENVWIINKLKSLKPQNTWKPSDEQMVVLELASKYERVFTPKQIDILIGLKEQLKKLKGE